MLLNHKQLINLPVYSQSRQFLGRISSFDFNPETQTIVKYYVAQSNFVKDLLNLNAALEIASAQVISISEEKMVVEDNITKKFISAKEKIKQQVAAMPASFSRISDSH